MAIERMASEAYVDGKVGEKYTRPQGGIPATDMSGDVRASLAKADTALQQQDISGKADQSTTYTKLEVDSIVQALKSGSRVVVQSLPQTGEAMKIYMVAKQDGQAGDVYDEYIWTEAGAWERIGSTSVDLSEYAKKSEVPTKVSDLTNDSGYLTEHQDISGKASLADVASVRADLPYRLVEPGKWEFSGSGYDPNSHVYLIQEIGPIDPGDPYTYELYIDGSYVEDASEQTDIPAMEVVFAGADITATRASLPGHLCDRAGNRVVVTGDTTLTLPAANPGYLRDFLVRLEISGSTVPTITFSAPTGETLTYETDGDEFPVPDEAGDWLYAFTENCVAHKFAVSLKKVNTVAQQGGS